MPSNHKPPTIAFPKNWAAYVKSAVLHVISLAQFATAYTRGWAANSVNARVRLKAEVERLTAEVALLCEKTHIKDARTARIDPHRRPHYPPTERMAILELRAARGWSLQQTASVFQVTAATIASWIKRVDDQGPDALVQIRQPVNRFPDFARHMVQRLKTLCPTMGKKKMAETLARAGLHIGATTIGRMLKERPAPVPQPSHETESTGRVVTARRPNHVWHVDLTIVPTASGFWCSWLPLALPQCWPFCWWVGLAMDHYSRRVMNFALFRQQPTSEAVRAFLGRTLAANHAKPKYIICDKGSQFWCAGFKAWCRRHGIRPRFGAVGKHGSIAVIERTILTLKQLLAGLPLIPLRHETFRRELSEIITWYNEHRPHTSLDGRTPNEVYFRCRPASRAPRWEPRNKWPRGSPCARPQTLVKGTPGVQTEVEVDFHAGRKHLPIVRVRRAA